MEPSSTLIQDNQILRLDRNHLNLISYFFYFGRNDDYQVKANWSPESSVKGGFDDRDIIDMHNGHEMHELHGNI